LAIGKVPVTFVVKLANVVEVVPVPPLEIGSVPVTPVVKLTAEGVAQAGAAVEPAEVKT
jgi:hypothetical protein